MSWDITSEGQQLGQVGQQPGINQIIKRKLGYHFRRTAAGASRTTTWNKSDNKKEVGHTNHLQNLLVP
jgi:hypothetical protein